MAEGANVVGEVVKRLADSTSNIRLPMILYRCLSLLHSLGLNITYLTQRAHRNAMSCSSWHGCTVVISVVKIGTQRLIALQRRLTRLRDYSKRNEGCRAESERIDWLLFTSRTMRGRGIQLRRDHIYLSYSILMRPLSPSIPLKSPCSLP